MLRASPVAELWADMDLMNRIITAGACRSLKERERVDLQRGVESYQLKNSVLNFQKILYLLTILLRAHEEYQINEVRQVKNTPIV